jgi:hypothetical protein
LEKRKLVLTLPGKLALVPHKIVLNWGQWIIGKDIAMSARPPLDDAALRKMGVTRKEYEARRNKHRKYGLELSKRAPGIGNMAPDFEVERLSASGVRTGQTFRLSSVRGEPAALVFGSYT